MKRLILVLLLLVAVARPALAQDQLDLSTVRVTGGPAEIANWQRSVTITKVTITSDQGVAFETSPIPYSWQVQIFNPQDPAPCPTDGCLEYTVWPVVHTATGWETAGIIQMWHGRPSTGAAILNGWQNWWGPAGSVTAGVFGNYEPHAGDLIGFFLSAGNARAQSTISSVTERSNVVLLNLPAGDHGVFDFTSTPPPPQPLPTPDPDLSALTARVTQLESFVKTLATTVQDAYDTLAAQIEVLNKFANDTSTRVSTLEAKPTLATCQASILGIPIHCALR